MESSESQPGPEPTELKRGFSRHGKILLFSAVILVVGVFVFMARVGFALRNELRAKITTGNISTLHAVLAAGQPTSLDPGTVESLLAEYTNGNLEVLVDGWHRPLRMEVRVADDGSRIYTIRSFGRDGLASSCCEKFVHHQWDKDAVMQGGRWLQVW